MNVAEFVWSRLREWGLTRVYGYPGDGAAGLDIALQAAIGVEQADLAGDPGEVVGQRGLAEQGLGAAGLQPIPS